MTGYDPFSSPTRPEGKFDLITCFEVIEHSPDPMGTLREMNSLLAPGGGILLGQSLQPPNIHELRCSWWYCAPRNGHCSTFTARSFAVAGDQVGLHFHPAGGRHAFVAPEGGPISELLRRISGPRLTVSTLGAPSDPKAPGWHGIEASPSGAFRWTCTNRIKWTVPAGASGSLEIRIPVRNAITPNFLKGCKVLVEGREAEMATEGQHLVARIPRLDRRHGGVDVELRTPQPQSPLALRGYPDDRPLGLAIAVI